MRRIILALLFVLLIWEVGFVWFITLVPTLPADDQQNTDAIVVLTGGSLRLERGFELLAQNRAKKMFISGVENNVTLASLLRKKDYQPYMARIPHDRVVLGHKARSTVGNAEETATWIAEEHFTSLRLVSGNYHIPRSILELHEAMPGVTIISEPVFPHHFENKNWWEYADSLKLMISEYHKYIAALLIHMLLEKS